MADIGKEETSIIERIKTRMIDNNLTQEALGKRLGIPQYEVSKILNGKKHLSIELLLKLPAALNTTLSYLLHYRESTFRELRAEDRRLLEQFDACDEETKRVILRLLGA